MANDNPPSKSHKKKNKDKDNKEGSQVHQRSTQQQGAINSIPEGNEENNKTGKGSSSNTPNPNNDSSTNVSSNSVDVDDMEHMRSMAEAIHSIQSTLMDHAQIMATIMDKVDNPEHRTPRNLHKEGAYGKHTPKQKADRKGKNKNKHKDKEDLSLLEIASRSVIRSNWKDTLNKKGKQMIISNDEDPSSSGSSDSESSTDSDNSKDSLSEHSSNSNVHSDVDPNVNTQDEQEDGNETEESKSKRKKRGKKKSNQLKSPSRNTKESAVVANLFNSLDLSKDKAVKTAITVTRAEKECSVRLSDFNLSNVCKAMKSIMEFQEREQTQVNMTKVLSLSVRSHLRLKYAVETRDLNTMPMSTLFSLLAQETKIHSSLEFYTELKSALYNVKLMEWDLVNNNNHQTYYFQQLNLAEHFMLTFKLMLKENKPYCPPIEDRRGGLIRLFGDLHSKRYWDFMYSSLKKHKYRTMQEFMDRYTKKAMEHYQMTQVTKSIPYKTKDSNYSQDKEKTYYDKKREISKRFNSGRYDRGRDVNHLNNVNHNNDSDSDSEEGNVWRQANPEKPDGTAQEIEDSEDSLSEGGERDQEQEHTQEDKDEEMIDTYLAAFGEQKPAAKADKKDYPCLRKILSGKCDYEGCQYGHRRETLLKGATDMKGKLEAYLKSSGETTGNSDQPYRVLNREKYTKA